MVQIIGIWSVLLEDWGAKMDKHHVMIEADKLLQRTSIYNTSNRYLITNMFDGHNKVDMALNIEIMSKQAKLFVLERASCVWNCYTEKEEIVIYAIILYLLEMITDKMTYNLFKNTEGHCIYSKEVKEYKKKLMTEAFLNIGAPYTEWNQRGITLWRINDIGEE